MPLQFTPPQFVYRPGNPADDFVRGNRMLVLGVTYPRYNDEIIDKSRGIVRPHPQTAPRAEQQDHQVLSLGQATHRFSWQISLPPNPVQTPWISQVVDWTQVNTIIQAIHPDRPRILEAPFPRVRLELLPSPDALSVARHIENHERQHAADHRWLAERIFGPWDTWLASKQLNPYTVKSLDSLAWVTAGGAYGLEPDIFLNYYREAVNESGRLFHHTDLGAGPVIAYEGVYINARREPIAQFTISFRRFMGHAPSFAPPQPHQYFRLPSVREFAQPASANSGTITAGGSAMEALEAPTLTQQDIDEHERPDDVGVDLSNFF
jgi:hypothetical protein